MKNICYNCFNTIEPDEDLCSLCGFDPKANREEYPMALPCGTVLAGRYIVGKVLGQGGFGITYLAQDYHRGSRVAVKEYFPENFASRTASISVSAHNVDQQGLFDRGKNDFLSEAEILKGFNQNGNIVHIHAYFEENQTAYFVMDYVEGISLGAYLKSRGGKISWDETMKLMMPVMEALNQVHQAGIIHRDVKPDNLFITREQCAVLLDFGSARYSTEEKSRSLSVIVTPGYAPKEQYIRRSHQGPYTDVYALAATMYRMITGIMPPESIERWDNDELIAPSRLGIVISGEDETALLKAMAVQQNERYQTMDALLRAFPKRMSKDKNIVSKLKPKRNKKTKKRTERAAEDQVRAEGIEKEEKKPASKEHSDIQALYNTGCGYYFGLEGCPQDHVRAAKYFLDAATKGLAAAQYNLGVCYENGQGFQQDEVEAVKWYRKAAQQGHSDAQYNLGICYENGQGIKRSMSEALYWYSMASKQGDADARNRLKVLGLEA